MGDVVLTKKNNTNKEIKEVQKQQQSFEDEFYELMFQMGLYNKFNNTYNLNIKNVTNYGYYAHLYLETGLSFQSILENKTTIQENLRCLWIMRTKQFSKYATVDIVINPLDEEMDYEVPKIKPWEMYMGLKFSLKTITNDNNDKCMFLISGATGSGKTRFIYMILLSWILSCEIYQVELYISDIAKNEYINFQYVQHVKLYASELHELLEMARVVKKKMKSRKNLLSKYREMGLATNIYDYNKISGVKKLPYCYMLIDEFSAIIPDSSDSKNEIEMKQEILDAVKDLSKMGRSLGIFLIVATQKTTRDEMPSVIKNMSKIRISFCANDSVSSEVIIGDKSACGLGDRIAVYSQNGGSDKDYLFSPKITMKRLNELLQPHIKHSKSNTNSNPRNNSNYANIEKVKCIPIKTEHRINDLSQFSRKGDEFIDY